MSAASTYRPVHGGYPDGRSWAFEEPWVVPIRWISIGEVQALLAGDDTEGRLRAYSGARGWTSENGDEA